MGSKGDLLFTLWYLTRLPNNGQEKDHTLRVIPPIPVVGPFNRVGVDVLHFTKSSSKPVAICSGLHGLLDQVSRGFAAPDQSAFTIAKLLVEKICPDMESQPSYSRAGELFSVSVDEGGLYGLGSEKGEHDCLPPSVRQTGGEV